MDKHVTLTQERFEQLLAWLDSDHEQAGAKYEEIRRSLIKILIWNGIAEAEDLADEIFNRVARNVGELESTYVGDPKLYFYGVANNLIKEHQRKRTLQVPLSDENVLPPSTDVHETSEDDEYDCFERCLKKLSTSNRELILSYYLKEKQTKIAHRKELAKRLKVDSNALRVRMYRIRATLERCIEDCLRVVGVED